FKLKSFEWIKERNYYKKAENDHSLNISIKNVAINNLSLRREFENDLFADENGIKRNVLECFTFPNVNLRKLDDDSYNKSIDKFDDMIEYLDFYEMNIIEGDDGGG